MAALLPSGFDELLCYVPGWVYGTEQQRNAFRVKQSQAALNNFYDDVLPRLSDISSALSNYSLDELPPQAINLLELALMCMEVAPAIEYYNNPDVPNAVEYSRFEIYTVPPAYCAADR